MPSSQNLSIAPGLTSANPYKLLFEPQKTAETGFNVHVGAGARATVIEELTGTSEDRWRHSVRVIVEDGAVLDFISFQHADAGARLTLDHHSSVGAQATIRWHVATLGGGETEHTLRSDVNGHGGVSDVNWMFYAKGTEKQRLTVRNVFNAPYGGGEITMKGVAQEQGSTKCEGMIEIGLRGGGTNTYLTQNVLMLDSTSKVDAIPGLEIKTNDVKASHSATVSRLTEEDLFYFAARGIPTLDARRMYVQGFLEDLTQKITDAATRAALSEAVERKYATGR